MKTLYYYHLEESDDGIKSKEIASLQWTTEPPTREGLYFAFSAEGVEIVHYRGNNETDVGIMDIEWRYPISNFSHWLGPLPVPEPPREGSK